MLEKCLDTTYFIENSWNLKVCCVRNCPANTVEPLYSGHPWRTTFWPLYRDGLYWGVVLYTNCSFGTWVPGRYTEVAFIQGWPLRRVPLYSVHLTPLLQYNRERVKVDYITHTWIGQCANSKPMTDTGSHITLHIHLSMPTFDIIIYSWYTHGINGGNFAF